MNIPTRVEQNPPKQKNLTDTSGIGKKTAFKLFLFHTADPKEITQGGLPAISTQL